MTHNPPTHFTQCRITVSGVVQGVGFRPFIWHLATHFKLLGEVYNNSEGVTVIVQGSVLAIRSFVEQIKTLAPAAASIANMEMTFCAADKQYHDFSIVSSEPNMRADVGICADLVTCKQCQQELFDTRDRRFHYPFINCTQCGPRFSILKELPYDRDNTSMRDFTQCPACQQEYDSPEGRRFHAQPNACPTCGPKLWLTDNKGDLLHAGHEIDAAVHYLKQGNILAVKGLGGFQLCADATNTATTAALRQRKRRPHKPFAVMVRDIASIEPYCVVSKAARQQLQSRAGPIVLLPIRTDGPQLTGIAPGQQRLGVMLPTTPLHALILQHFSAPLLMTSANASGEPQCIDNDAAYRELQHVANYFLVHNRTITQRLDDSVLQLSSVGVTMLRRARGYAPAPLLLPAGLEFGETVLAMGSDLKNTFCMLEQGQALLSQYIGDLGSVRVERDVLNGITTLANMRGFTPKTVVTDQHPSGRCRQLANKVATQYHAELEDVQHHHAHLAACIGEHGYPDDDLPVLGICMDGLGYARNASDVQLWGAELLLFDYAQYRRLATLRATPLPGGDKANSQPWRNSVAHLHSALGWQHIKRAYPDLTILTQFSQQGAEQLISMMQHKQYCPLSSSAGRLFDAVAAILGMCSQGDIEYEGKAAMLLEASITPQSWQTAVPYPFELNQYSDVWQIEPAPMWSVLLEDCHKNEEPSVIAARFHKGLADIYAKATLALASCHSATHVALSGGVMQNQYLLERLVATLGSAGLHVMTHQQLPANDAGLAFGQALIARSRQRRCKEQKQCV
ncbi:carbamoyltransferase HypF [Aestuariibacter salexigens]|uniref:carbamoyltransferase HypF n=1 Tax=Aestuariibacter salexigens TaxID=226010 RepID=UPI000428B995|nr:carbamoyltransferase HypF [Aestuariibacter salexigens]